MSALLPRVLVVDDECGREVEGGNRDRRNLCDALGLVDVTPDSSTVAEDSTATPLAAGVFIRGQSPVRAAVGDVVENDLDAIIRAVRRGWDLREPHGPPWSLVLMDLGFRTGEVTSESHAGQFGMAAGRDDDLVPASYFGVQALRALREQFPEIPVAILSSQARAPVDHRIDPIGHCGFVSKTGAGSKDRLRELLRTHGLYPDPVGGIVGHSSELLIALRDTRRVARGSRPVLILGESGTGKELFARYLHANSARAGGAYVPVDSSVFPESLSESELFGILDRTATGVRKRPGLIARADKGHLFMDEVGNMPMRIQEQLLRVIESRIVRPVGMGAEKEAEEVNVRFLFATNSDLDGRVLAETFREDLLYRLREGGQVTLPPLRHRLSDIPILLDFFLQRIRTELPDAEVTAIAADAIDFLQSHHWPGNVRELATCLHRAVASRPNQRTLHREAFEFLPGLARPSGSTERFATRARSEGSPPEAPGPQGGWPDLPESVGLEWPSTQLKGSLPATRAEYARRLAVLLRDAILAESDSIDGKPNYTAAVSLLRGKKVRDTTQAADEIKRILKIDQVAIADILASPPLSEAWAWCRATRPTRKAKSTRQRKRS
jgi:DNA-binding NtrC family response regulator